MDNVFKQFIKGTMNISMKDKLLFELTNKTLDEFNTVDKVEKL